jgi:hypothetical protein
MNLRLVHAFLILMSSALAVLFGVWNLSQSGNLVVAIVSFVVAVGLVVYDSWFLRKTRTLR